MLVSVIVRMYDSEAQLRPSSEAATQQHEASHGFTSEPYNAPIASLPS